MLISRIYTICLGAAIGAVAYLIHLYSTSSFSLLIFIAASILFAVIDYLLAGLRSSLNR